MDLGRYVETGGDYTFLHVNHWVDDETREWLGKNKHGSGREAGTKLEVRFKMFNPCSHRRDSFFTCPQDGDVCSALCSNWFNCLEKQAVVI